MNQLFNFVINHWPLWVALAVILALIAGLEFQAKLRGIPSLSPAQATDKINREDAKVIDLREEALYQQGHITDAIHFPLASQANAANQFKKYLDQPLILVDQNGQQTLKTALAFRQQGFQKVEILQGGIMAWSQAGLPLVKG